MIICKRLAHPDDHLQKIGSSGWPFAKAGPSRWSFAKGRLIRMIIWKRPANPDDQLQKAGPSRWSHDSHCNILLLYFSWKCEKFSPGNPFWPKIINTSFNSMTSKLKAVEIKYWGKCPQISNYWNNSWDPVTSFVDKERAEKSFLCVWRNRRGNFSATFAFRILGHYTILGH